MKPQRLAAIDIGTNSIRCIVAETAAAGEFRVLDDEKATVRLGEGMAVTGEISPAAWERARDGLLRMKKIVDGLGVSAVEAVATSAVRKAANGEEFTRAMARETGIEIRVISGEQEAELAALSAWRHFDMDHARYVLVDIGGGSVEVVTAAGRHIEEIFSLELGAVLMTEQFLRRDPLPEKDLNRLRRHVRTSLEETLGDGGRGAAFVIGSGGTMSNIGGMAMAMRREKYDSVHGYEVLRSEVVHLLAMLQRRSVKERRTVPGLQPDRADIIVAGVTVADELMRFFDANLLRINERGIREGLILQSLQKHGFLPEAKVARDWRSAVTAFARSCHSDEEHAHNVAALSLKIFDALADPFGLSDADRRLLEAAALLHDVGYFISYSQHHKHSYHLIRHASLFGFTPRELEVMANIARYHRKAPPKKKHENFVRLGAEDRERVKKLGGILRLADGLDRRRAGAVKEVACTLTGATCTLGLEGGEDLSVELYGGMAKADLFEEAFRRKLVLHPR